MPFSGATLQAPILQRQGYLSIIVGYGSSERQAPEFQSGRSVARAERGAFRMDAQRTLSVKDALSY